MKKSKMELMMVTSALASMGLMGADAGLYPVPKSKPVRKKPKHNTSKEQQRRLRQRSKNKGLSDD